MMRLLGAAALLTTLGAAPAFARDVDSPWFVRVGASRLSLADGVRLDVGGMPVPDAATHTDPRDTVSVQIGRRLTPLLAIAFTLGAPPKFTLTGRQALAPFGRLAQVTAGPAAVTGQLRPFQNGTVQPYVGAGAAYLVVTSTKDGTFANVKVDNRLGPIVEGGTDILFTRHIGLFVDVKKSWITTNAHGTFGGAPVLARVRLDPVVLSAGAMFRF